MPTVLKDEGYRLFFYSDEGNPREPPHVHAVCGDKTAKFWLVPVSLVRSRRMTAAEITALQRMVEKHRDRLLRAWNDHFDD